MYDSCSDQLSEIEMLNICNSIGFELPTERIVSAVRRLCHLRLSATLKLSEPNQFFKNVRGDYALYQILRKYKLPEQVAIIVYLTNLPVARNRRLQGVKSRALEKLQKYLSTPRKMEQKQESITSYSTISNLDSWYVMDMDIDIGQDSLRSSINQVDNDKQSNLSSIQNKVPAKRDVSTEESMTNYKSRDKTKNRRNNMDPLIFISHCDEDKRFSGELISLLQRVGIPDEYIFSYSSPAHGLSLGENIYEGLRNRLIHDQKTFVIFLLSKDFYRSVDCLNEMGAAWITSKKTVGVLIPPFDFSQVKGVIEKGNIHMRVNEKLKLNELRDMLASFGNLPLKQGTSWEIIRDDFIDKVDSILNQDNLLTEFEEELKRI